MVTSDGTEVSWPGFKDSPMTILFYSTGGEYGCFSNFSNHPLKYLGQQYRTSEAAFQAQKFTEPSLQKRVRLAKNAGEAARIGRDRKLPLRKDWESVKDNVMREVVMAKFQQNESCCRTLLGTGLEPLIEHTENDRYWADGGDGSGKNMLGIILMETRMKLNGIMVQARKIAETNG